MNNEILSQGTTETNEPTVVESTNGGILTQNDPTVPAQEHKAVPTDTPIGDAAQSAQNAAFAQLRIKNNELNSQNSAYATALKARGFESIQDFLDRTNEPAATPPAPTVPEDITKHPEYAKLLGENNEYKTRIRTDERRREMADLVKSYNLSNSEVNDFIKHLDSKNVNVLISNSSLSSLFFDYNPGLFVSKLQTPSAGTNQGGSIPPARITNTPAPTNDVNSGKLSDIANKLASTLK